MYEKQILSVLILILMDVCYGTSHQSRINGLLQNFATDAYRKFLQREHPIVILLLIDEVFRHS